MGWYIRMFDHVRTSAEVYIVYFKWKSVNSVSQTRLLSLIRVLITLRAKLCNNTNLSFVKNMIRDQSGTQRTLRF